MILNTGDVPNLYQADEKVEILEKMTAALQALVNNFVECYSISISTFYYWPL